VVTGHLRDRFTIYHFKPISQFGGIPSLCEIVLDLNSLSLLYQKNFKLDQTSC
jgi:hypothetical protein